MKFYNYKDGSQAWLDDAEYKEAKRGETLLEIADCKALLSATDYKAIKFAEGELSAEEYETIRIERRNLRARINELEKEI